MKPKLSFLPGLCGALVALFPPQSFAQGSIDSSFHSPYTDGYIYSVVVDSQTNIWIGGDFETVNGITIPSLAVLRPDGTLIINAFPQPDVYGYVVSLAVDSQDYVYVAYRGYIPGGKFSDLVVRFVPDSITGGWTQDTDFAANMSGQTNVWISELNSISVGSATDPHNPNPDYLYVAGTINQNIITSGSPNITNVNSYPVALYDHSGNLVSAFGQLFNESYPLVSESLDITSSPEVQQILYVNGGASQSPDLLIAGNFGVARIPYLNGEVLGNYVYVPPADLVENSTGCTCGAERDMTDQVNCPSPYGEILAGGQDAPFDSDEEGFRYGAGDMFMCRLGAENSTAYFAPISEVTNYPADNGSFISQIIALPAGDMLVAGYITSIRGVGVDHFAHLLPDGTVDQSFENNTELGAVLDMAVQPDGKYVLVGAPQYTLEDEPQVERRLALPATGVTFDGPPQPATQTAYAGDRVSFTAYLTAWPSFTAQWEKNGGTLTGQTSTYLQLNNITTNDSGQYQLAAQLSGFCTTSPVLSGSATLTVLPAPPPPANDAFANAIPLNGIAVTGMGTIRSATLDPGETDPYGVYDGRSVWWTWTAPFSGLVEVNVGGCDFPAAIGLFTGSSVASLSVVTNNYDYEGGGLLGNFQFNVTAGTTYQIALGGQPNVGSLGDIVFTIAPTGSAWQSTAALTTKSLEAVATGNGQIVAVGSSGTIVTSSDGAHWSLPSSPVTVTLRSVAYGDGQFVVVGSSGDILTSVNGTTWTKQTSGTTSSMHGVAFGNGKFVAVGNSDAVLTSPDGVNWTAGTTGTGDSFNGITFANNLFIIETTEDDGALLYSNDGQSWSQAAINTSDEYFSVSYGNGKFVGVGEEGTVIASTDGMNWDETTNGPGLLGIAFGDGRFVAVGNDGLIELSTDGTNWVQDNAGTINSLAAVAGYGASQFVAVGANGTILVSQLPSIAVFALQKSGLFQLSLTGLSGSTAILEAATTLSPPNWQPISTNVIVNGTVTFSDANESSSKYYRALLQ